MAPNPPAHGLHPEEDDDDFLDLEGDDEQIYKKAVEMHRPGGSRNQPASLKESCVDFYIDRAEEWLSIKRETSVNVFDFMPSFLRDQILECLDVWESWELKLPPHRLCSLICLVMPKQMRTMHVGSLLEAVKWKLQRDADITGGINKIVDKLSEDSPNLKELTFNMRCSPRSNYSFDQHKLFDHLKAGNFQNLVKLDLEIIDNLGNKELKIIARNYPLLEYLRLELSPSIKRRKLVASISKLKRLRFFFYLVSDGLFMEPDNKYALEDRIFNLCAKKLPQLEYLRSHDTPENNVELCCDEHVLYFSGTSQLRQLCCAEELPEASLPNLSDLCFKGPILDTGEFDIRVSLYTNLSTLELSEVEEERVCLLLQRVGHQLNVLYLNSEIRFDDLKILQLCPKLVKLRNIGCYQNSLKSLLEYRAERNIRRKLYFLRNMKLDFCSTRAPQGLLKILLASAKLVKLVISDITISSEDSKFFSQLKCPSLKHFHLMHIQPAMDCSIRDLEMIVRGLSIHLSLKCCIVTLHPDLEDPGSPYYRWDANVDKYILLHNANCF